MIEIALFSLLIAVVLFGIFILLPNDRTLGFGALKAKEYERAFELLKPYADRNDGPALAAIGGLYHGGLGVQSDAKAAFEHYQKAYRAGFDPVTLLLAKMYAKGEGVKADEKEALEWLKKAAAQQNGEAMRLIGDAFSEGSGTLQDFVQAHRWYNLASLSGDKEAKTKLKALTKQMTPDLIKTAQELAKPAPKDG